MAHALDDGAAAAEAFREAWAILSKLYPPASAEVTQARHALETVYEELGRYADAAVHRRESLKASQATFGLISEEARADWMGLARIARRLGDYRAALAHLNEACAITDHLYGKSSAEGGMCLFEVAETISAAGKPEASLTDYQRACTLLISDQGKHARCANRLAMTLVELGRFEEAVSLFQRAAEQNQALGDHKSTVANYLNLTQVYESLGDYTKAASASTKALEALSAQGSAVDPLDVARAIAATAAIRHALGQLAEAQLGYEQALSILERKGDSDEVVSGLNSLALVLGDRGMYDEAETLLERALKLLQSGTGLQSKDGSMVLGNLGGVKQDRGKYREAQTLYKQALEISESVHVPGDPARAHYWNNLGDVLKLLGEYPAAEKHYRRALEIWVTAFGENHRLVATAYNNLGNLHLSAGNYKAAEHHLRKAIDITERVLPPGHPDWAGSLNNLAKLYSDRGEYDRAETLYLAVFHAFTKALGDQHPLVGLAYNNLGALYGNRGDLVRAARFFRSAADLARKNDDPRALGLSLYSFATILDKADQFADARSTYREALAALESVLGPEHPEVGFACKGLASILAAEGKFEESEKILRRVVANVRRVEGENTPGVAANEASLAFVLSEQGRFREAEQLYTHAASIIKDKFGDGHPHFADMLSSLAVSQWAAGSKDAAIQNMKLSLVAREKGLSSILATGSEEERQLFMGTSRMDMYSGISMHAHGYLDDSRAAELGLLVVLQRKGRVLDVTADTTRVLRANLDEEGQALFSELREQRARIARFALASQAGKLDARSELQELERKARTTEAKLSRHSHAFRDRSAPVTVEAVQQAIPEGSLLVEIVRYYPLDPRQQGRESWKPERYAAYMMSRSGSLQYVDLGEAELVDRLVGQFRKALADPMTDVLAAAQRLHAQVMAPIAARSAGADHLLIAPDGALNLVPFGALADGQGRFVVESTAITYLATGRELLRSTHVAARTPVQIIANPTFGRPRRKSSHKQQRTLLSDLGIVFDPLTGTAREGKALRTMMPGARLTTGTAASEAFVKALRGPQILHFATHGYFLADSQPSETKAGRGGFSVPSRPELLPSVQSSANGAPVEGPKNPLLRAGLALASANTGQVDQDGLLTAMEAASLDLWGTELVVLSACDTGVGEVRAGQGVYGLRRAFSLAGAESLVMSLWEIGDTATEVLMVGFYRRLVSGEARTAALRAVQLEMLTHPQYRHPYYWASFVHYGRGGPLSAGQGQAPRAGGFLGR